MLGTRLTHTDTEKKINGIIEKIENVGFGILEDFSELNDEEKKELGKKLSTFSYSFSKQIGYTGLQLLLDRGYDSPELIRYVIQAIEKALETSAFKEPNSSDLLNCLFHPANQGMQFQKDILKLLIEHFNRISLDSFEMPYKVIEKAMESGSDDAALELINRSWKILKELKNSNKTQEKINTISKLLIITCNSKFRKPRCVRRLVELGATLPVNYDNAFLRLQFDQSSSPVNPPGLGSTTGSFSFASNQQVTAFSSSGSSSSSDQNKGSNALQNNKV